MGLFGLVLQHILTLGLAVAFAARRWLVTRIVSTVWRRWLLYCRTIVPIVAATIETIVRHSTPKSNCVEALVLQHNLTLG